MLPPTQQALDDRVASLEQTIDTLERLLSISGWLNSTHEMRPLLQRIVESTAELTNADGASILLMEDSETLRFATATGPESATLSNTAVPLDRSLAGWVVDHREMAIVENALDDPRIFDVEGVNATRSIIAAPMLYNEQVVGVLESVTTTNRHIFTEQDQRTMMTLASVAAVAVQNARFFQQSDWVAEVVHEIRTPLTAILSYTDLLGRPDLDAAVRERAVRTIRTETERVSSLATGFLDLARLESGRVTMGREPVEVTDLMSHAVEVLASTATQRGLAIHVLPAASLPTITGDRDRLHQVLLNLLSNAIKYAKPGDTVAVDAKVQAGELVVSVQDTGPGIPQDELPYLFRKFQRLRGSDGKAPGTGLGLVVARQIVEAHRGRMWVESTVGEGSCFSFALPVDGAA